MKTLVERAFRSVAMAVAIPLVLLISTTGVHAQSPLLVYDFHLGMEPAENVEYVRSLGFRGLVTRLKYPADLLKLEAYASHVATIEDFDLLAYVSYDFTDSVSSDVWRLALPTLASLGAPLWVVVKKAPSETAVRELLEQMARESVAFGLRTVIYPHWNTDIRTAAEASALIQEIGHANLRNSLHTCHEIRGGNQYDMKAVVSEHAAETALVAIAGAADDAYAGPFNPFVTWGDCIKPLDEGQYSLYTFLQALHTSGYDGPVILQTFGITNNPGHLERSIRKYAEYTELLARRDA